jgi:cytochrome c-type biogenesis protein CcmE
MKKSHIFLLVVIAIAIGIIVSTADDASTYVGFGEAWAMSTSGNNKEIHVVGQLKKDKDGQIIGIKEGEDRVSFSFIMVDDAGKEQQVNYNQPMPPDFTRSEKVVVIGSYNGDTFNASRIILKCPSKYQEEKITV